MGILGEAEAKWGGGKIQGKACSSWFFSKVWENYEETFSLIAKMIYVRVVISLATGKG